MSLTWDVPLPLLTSLPLSLVLVKQGKYWLLDGMIVISIPSECVQVYYIYTQCVCVCNLENVFWYALSIGADGTFKMGNRWTFNRGEIIFVECYASSQEEHSLYSGRKPVCWRLVLEHGPASVSCAWLLAFYIEYYNFL